MALASPSWDADRAVGADPGGTGAPQVLAFMPRLFVLTTLPHRRPQGHRFERINGWQSMRMVAPRRIGLPYGVYPRLLLMFITTEAVRKKSREIYLGATPNDLARKLGVSIISGPRGTAIFDNRSFRLNFEITAVVVDSDFAAEVDRMLEADFAQSRRMEPGEYDAKPWWFRFAVNLARLTSPVQ